MASGKFNTMSEGLSKIASDIPDLLATPDGIQPANQEFLIDLLAQVTDKLREMDLSIPTGPGGQPLPQAPPDGVPPEIAALMGGPGGPPAAGPPGPPLAGGLQRRPGIPNPDDLARLNAGPS